MNPKTFIYKITENHYLLMQSYRTPRSYTASQKAINYYLGKHINLPRKIPSLTQELVDWGLVERTNPGSSCREGYKHKITLKGKEVIQEYESAIRRISEPCPKFGF